MPPRTDCTVFPFVSLFSGPRFRIEQVQCPSGYLVGKVNSAKRESFFVNYATSGTRVRLNYATKFTEGDADEEFVWAKSENDYAPVGYHNNSMALITK